MEMPLRTLIVDDESPARRWLKELLQAHPQLKVVAEAESVANARALLLDTSPDILFLDVQMPPDTGFDLLPYLSSCTRVVFVTAYDNFAVKAFEANAMDYLLKPVRPERLADTVSRLLATTSKRINRCKPDTPPGDTGESTGFSLMTPQLQLEDLLPLRDRGRLRMVPVKQVAAIKAEGAYTQIIISGQESMLVLQPIGDWEERLPTPPFARVDRSRLINLSRVKEVQTIDRNQTHVWFDRVSTPFELGRSASRRLRELLR